MTHCGCFFFGKNEVSTEGTICGEYPLFYIKFHTLENVLERSIRKYFYHCRRKSISTKFLKIVS